MLRFSTSIISVLLLSSVLSGCSGNQVEGLFVPDPKLETPTTPTTPVAVTPTQLTLPPEFPSTIPVYPEAAIKAIAPDSGTNQGIITWTSTDPSNLIESYYQQQLESRGWVLATQTTENQVSAQKDNLDLEIALNSSASATEIVVTYQSQTPTVTETPSTSVVAISDLEGIPSTHQQYIQDLAKLGIFSDTDWGDNQTFQPNQVITRREYARWLLETNNRLQQNNPSQQINLISQAIEPAFTDVTPDDPDFSIIQGLAEAGIIPSRLLSGDNTALQFNPDSPLTRGDLIAWKVPLDYRKALPTTSVNEIRDTWGFQDVASIDIKVLQALHIDYQTGEAKSNVRRAFGYTTLFQPDKPVTRAEAAAVLWYFGYQNQGISAAEIPEN